MWDLVPRGSLKVTFSGIPFWPGQSWVLRLCPLAGESEYLILFWASSCIRFELEVWCSYSNWTLNSVDTQNTRTEGHRTSFCLSSAWGHRSCLSWLSFDHITLQTSASFLLPVSWPWISRCSSYFDLAACHSHSLNYGHVAFCLPTHRQASLAIPVLTQEAAGRTSSAWVQLPCIWEEELYCLKQIEGKSTVTARRDSTWCGFSHLWLFSL